MTSSKRAVASAAIATLLLSGIAISPSAVAVGTSRASHAAGCAAEAPSYPGARLTDCVALRDNTVFLDQVTVGANVG